MNDIDTLKQQSLALARLFRQGQHVRGALDMLPLLEAALPLLQAMPEKAASVTPLLQAMLACQERQDWIGLADYFEYELLELLN